MDTIGDLLPNNLGQPPEEFAKVKEFIMTRYRVNSAVALSRQAIVITVPDSAVAMELRMNQLELQTTCNIDVSLKIVIRINPTI